MTSARSSVSREGERLGSEDPGCVEREYCDDDAPPESGTHAGAPPTSSDERPTIVIGVDVEQNGDALTAAIALDGRTYQRAGELVYIARATDDAATDERAPVALGSPLILPMALATLFERSASSARWIRVNADGEPRPAMPSSAVVAAVHARGYWSGIPPIVAIAESPFMRPSGTLVQTPGYDAATGYYYAPNAVFPHVPERPSRVEARKALAQLCDLFVDFPFIDDAARMVPIAAQLTLQVRPAIEGAVPFFGFDAPTRATGKGLAGSVAVESATGRPPPLATFPNGRDGQAELEKMLGAYALSGAPVVFFDNVPIGVPFGGAPVEKCVTAPDKVALRRLGQSEVPELSWRAVIMANGNNLTIADETARRGFVARMVSTLERPEERAGFKYPELLQHVRANRPEFVAAGLTIVRAYVAAGSPDTGTMSLGSFEAWSRLIPRAIVWAGGADIMGARVTVTGGTDEATATLVAILDRLPRLLEGHEAGLTANAILDALYPGPGPHEAPDGWGDLRAALESATGARTGIRPDTARLGTYFRGHRDRNVDGKTLVVLGTHARANRWGVR